MKKEEDQNKRKTLEIEIVIFPDEEYTAYFVGDRINGHNQPIEDFRPHISDKGNLTLIKNSARRSLYLHAEGAKVEAYSKEKQGVITITGVERQIVGAVRDLGQQLVSEQIAIRKINGQVEEEKYKF